MDSHGGNAIEAIDSDLELRCSSEPVIASCSLACPIDLPDLFLPQVIQENCDSLNSRDGYQEVSQNKIL